MSTQRSAILITGLVLLLIGGIILLSGAQSPNPASNTIGAIFALIGTIANYLQIFSALSPKPAPIPESSPTREPVPARRPIPTSTPSLLVYFRLSGIVLIIGDIIFAAIGLIPYSLYTQPTFISSINLILGITILLFSLGLPALQIKQSYQTRWLGLSGVAALCTSSLLFGIYYFLTSINPYQSNYPLFYVANALQIIGSILLGIAIIRTSTFPRWTGMLLIVSGIIFIGSFMAASLSDTALYIINNAAMLPSCIAFIGCGYTLLQQSKGNATARSSSSS